MTIEIVRMGTKPGDRKVSGECFTCHSKMRWLSSDGRHTDSQHDGEANYIECPVCGQKVPGSYET